MTDSEKTALINALSLIQTICQTHHPYCGDCPVGDKTANCAVLECIPCKWRINSPSNEWKALV